MPISTYGSHSPSCIRGMRQSTAVRTSRDIERSMEQRKRTHPVVANAVANRSDVREVAPGDQNEKIYRRKQRRTDVHRKPLVLQWDCGTSVVLQCLQAVFTLIRIESGSCSHVHTREGAIEDRLLQRYRCLTEVSAAPFGSGT